MAFTLPEPTNAEREELAQLCDVSPTWLTWLEQGRPVSASAKMLSRLAQVLQLSQAERAYRTAFGDTACLKMVLDWRQMQ